MEQGHEVMKQENEDQGSRPQSPTMSGSKRVKKLDPELNVQSRIIVPLQKLKACKLVDKPSSLTLEGLAEDASLLDKIFIP